MAMRGCDWFISRTNLEKTLLSFSILLLLTCIIIIVVGVVQNSQKDDDANEVCKSQLCIQTAGRMLSMMDKEADPCEDFYQFSCGDFVKAHAAPDKNSVYSVEKESGEAVLLQLKNWLESTIGDEFDAVKKAKTTYKTCMEYDIGKNQVMFILNQSFFEMDVAQWPLLDTYWEEKEGDLEKSLKSLALLGIPLVFDMKVVEDETSPGNYILKLLPGKPQFVLTKPDQVHDSWIQQFFESALINLEIRKSLTTSKMDTILNTEIYVQKLKESSDKECGDENYSDLQSIKLENFRKMEDIMSSNINWVEILSGIFEVLNTTSTWSLPIEVYCRRHVRDFNEFPKNFYIYLGWRFFSSFMEYLSPEFHWLHLGYQYHFNKQESKIMIPRWKECMNLMEEHWIPLLAHTYINQTVVDATLKQKVKIASGLRTILANYISMTKWLETTAQQRLIQKVQDVKFEIPVPKSPWDMEKINNWFSNVQVENDHLALNVLRLRKFATIQELKRILDPKMEKLELKVSSLTNSEFLPYIENRIAVHFDKLRSPYLSPELQSYLNYGAFGTFLARELNQYLGSKDLKHLNANNTIWELFLQSEQGNKCLNMKTEFSPVDIMDYSREKWISAFSELIAVQAAYSTYQVQKSEDLLLPGLTLEKNQMFFISYAQSMCEVGMNNNTKLPAKTRVNFALQNMDQFHEAFSCTKGSRMYSSDKCRVMG